MTEAEWLSAADATDLWAFVRNELRFNRNVVKNLAGKKDDYNQRLLYLLGVAVCRRLETLFPDPCCQRMLEVAESFAEGRATLDELADANEASDRLWISDMPAAVGAAYSAVFWLGPDEYKVIRGVDCATDAAGYLHAIAAGVLPAGASRSEGEAIWKHPTFLAGKEVEERNVCDIIRDVIGNPFHPLPPKRGRKKWEQMWRSLLAWNDAVVVRLAQAAYDERHLPSGTLDSSRLAVLADALEEAGCTSEEILDHLRGPGPHVRGCWPVDLCLGKS